MTDEENTAVNPVVAEPEASRTEPPADTQSPSTPQSSTEDQDHNWREMRSVVRDLADKNKVLEQQVAQLTAPPPKQVEPDELDSLAEDDIITKKQLMTHTRKMQSQAKKDAFDEFYNKTAEERLENKHPDFRSVVSPGNIETLKQRFPDLAKSLASNSDAFSQGKAVYDLIVSLGIHNKESQVNKQKMEENSRKPQYASGGKTGPLDAAHLFESGQRPALTSTLKQELWKQTQEAARG